jgi:hypothetical protein
VAELAAHVRHDPLRVAEAVDRGARLAPVLDLCARCASLYADLVALRIALPLAAIPGRPRDFTLSARDARRLRPGGWRSWWSILGSARDSLTRPLAIGFTTLGLAGLLLTTAPTLLPLVGGATGANSVAAIGVDRVASSPQPGGLVPSALGADPATPPREANGNEVAADPSPTMLVSAGLLAIGGGLFAVRRIAGHRRWMR